MRKKTNRRLSGAGGITGNARSATRERKQPDWIFNLNPSRRRLQRSARLWAKSIALDMRVISASSALRTAGWVRDPPPWPFWEKGQLWLLLIGLKGREGGGERIRTWGGRVCLCRGHWGREGAAPRRRETWTGSGSWRNWRTPPRAPAQLQPPFCWRSLKLNAAERISQQSSLKGRPICLRRADGPGADPLGAQIPRTAATPRSPFPFSGWELP